VGHFLAQTEAEFFSAMLKIIGGGAVTALLFGALWAVLTGKGVVPRYIYDAKCKECDNQRVRAEVAEGNLLKALTTGDRIVSATEKLANNTPPATADRGRQP
jgi:hypothetical protein